MEKAVFKQTKPFWQLFDPRDEPESKEKAGLGEPDGRGPPVQPCPLLRPGNKWRVSLTFMGHVKTGQR